MDGNDDAHSSMKKDIQYPFAYDENNKLVWINDIKENKEHRYDHKYHCPNCGHSMRTNIGSVNAPYFSHDENQKCSLESYIHSVAKRLLADRFNDRTRSFTISLKAERECINAKECNLEQDNCFCKPKDVTEDLHDHYDLPAVVEKTSIDGDFRADVLLKSSNIKRKDIFIEVYYTHQSSIRKIQSENRIIEIRIRDISDLEKLKSFDCLRSGPDVVFHNFKILVQPVVILNLERQYAEECEADYNPGSYPSCLKNLEAVQKYGKWPFCGGKLLLRNGRKGQFYGCSNYPQCDYYWGVNYR